MKLKDLVREAMRPFRPSSASAKRVLAALREFEDQYGISTQKMRRMFRHGQIEDTADTSRWLLLARLVPDWYIEGRDSPPPTGVKKGKGSRRKT